MYLSDYSSRSYEPRELLSSLPLAHAVKLSFIDARAFSIVYAVATCQHAPLPNSSSDTSFDTVGYDLNDRLFELQLGSTEYHFARKQLDFYEQLLDAHSGDVICRLPIEDRLYLLSFNRIEYPTPPPSQNRSAMAPPTSSTGNTIIIANKNYSISKLQGQEDYQVWKIQMEDMFQDIEVLEIVEGTTLRPSNNQDAAFWDKQNKASLGALRRRVETGPMTHIACCTSIAKAWAILKNQYQSLYLLEKPEG
ncbi:hypothetical protein RhiTH_009400 [Rhizoctonia solani]